MACEIVYAVIKTITIANNSTDWATSSSDFAFHTLEEAQERLEEIAATWKKAIMEDSTKKFISEEHRKNIYYTLRFYDKMYDRDWIERYRIEKIYISSRGS